MADLPNVANVYIGWDPREVAAYQVAADTLVTRSSIPVHVTPLRLPTLELAGLMRRPRTAIAKGRPMLIQEYGNTRQIVAKAGVQWDDISGAPMTTEFANSRFLVPLIAHAGWAVFCDCDVVWLGDVAELLALADPDFALMCVQHGALDEWGSKMDGQPQLPYRRKNWSSVILWNCDHPANRRLTLDVINARPGRDLHRFCWLEDQYIGRLPPAWNWLVNVEPFQPDAKLAHFTLGGPWITAWTGQPYDDLWLSAARALAARNRAGDAGGS